MVQLQKECDVACGLCPDVVEWCPDEGYDNVLAYGLYELEEATKTRHGALHLARVGAPPAGGGDDLAARPPATVTALDTMAMAGVYDVAWGPRAGAVSAAADEPDSILLAVACADGALRLVRVGGGGTIDRAAAASHVIAEESILTHVAWNPCGECAVTAVSQGGSAYHVKAREDGSLAVLAEWAAHKLEVWCVEASPADPHLVFTGADDSCLFGWDLREAPAAAPALANRRAHEAGVTALACDPLDTHRLASGSYDERVRLFDMRALAGTPAAESDRLGDGAYQLAWHPAWPGTLAVAAMRSGFPLLRCCAAGGLREVGRYAADAPEGTHGSLGYGVSWRRSPAGDSSWMAASASFYDRSVHVWSAHGGAGDPAAAQEQQEAPRGGTGLGQ